MNGAELIETPQWSFASIIGYKEHPLFTINSETVVHTWIIMFFLVLMIACVNVLLRHTKLGRFLLLKFVSFFIDLTNQSLGFFSFAHCVFAASLFIFIALYRPGIQTTFNFRLNTLKFTRKRSLSDQKLLLNL